jgi:hypothetical protein
VPPRPSRSWKGVAFGPGMGYNPGAIQGGDMKKKSKKLVLSKETLKTLEQPVLQEAAGGATNVSDCFQCSAYWTQCYCGDE